MTDTEHSLQFAKIDDVSQSFSDHVAAANEMLGKSSQIDESFDPLCITQCPKRLVCRSRGDESRFGTTPYSEANHKEFILEKWGNIFRRSGKIKVMDANVVTADNNYNLTGIVDFVVAFDKLITPVKIYPTRHDLFMTTETKPSKRHVVDVMLNAWMMEINNALLIYEDNDNQNNQIFHVTLYKPLINSVALKCRELMEYKIRGDLPERPYKEQTIECHFCEFINNCWRED